MADSFFSAMCSFALKQLGMEGLEQVKQWLGDHFSDQGRRLTHALKDSNEKAWRALEIALAGEGLWNKLDRADDRAFRQQLAAFLKQLPMPELQGKPTSRKKVLEDVREARKKGLLVGRLSPEELADRVGPMAERSDPQKVLAAEKKALLDVAAVIRRANLEALAWLLEQPVQPGQSLLVVSVRYYFRRAVEEDVELARGLQFTAMEQLTEAQQKGFQELDAGLRAHAGRVEQVLGGLIEVAEKMLGAADDVLDATLDLRSEMEHMRGEHKELYGRVLQMLEQQQMHQRPVHVGDSLSIRSDGERQRVKEFLAHYRRLPEEQRRSSPALLNGLGKLQVATGDYQNAQEAFTRVAEMSPDAKSRAEGHYNAYHAALERASLEDGSYQTALAELKQALRHDPARFAPFPLNEYEPRRILGAGGFGVTFLCWKHAMSAEVAVKALQTEGLDRDAGSVIKEASLLKQLTHPAIIRVNHCGYADAERRRPFLEMDYFDGMTLDAYVRKHGVLSVGNTLAVAKTVAEALRDAHAKGILHRDVKPANLLVRRPEGRWEVRVIDFGLAMKQSLLGQSASGSRANRSMTGAEIAGTRHYAAPEQLGELPGVRVGTWSDVYGWAKTCCYALFQNAEPTFLDYKKIPEMLGVLLGQCLARLPNDRPSGFPEVLERLAKMRADAHKPPPKQPNLQPPPPKLVPPPPQKLPQVVAPVLEILPITALETAAEPLPAAIPVYPSVIPTGRSSSRYPQAAPPSPPPPPLPPPRPMMPYLAPPVTRGPGIAIVVVGIVALLTNVGILFPHMVAMSEGHFDGETDTVMGLLFAFFALASAVSIVSGVLMLNRKVYALSLTGCFLAMLPIGICAVVGLPIGIWGAAVLMRPGVRGTFA